MRKARGDAVDSVRFSYVRSSRLLLAALPWPAEQPAARSAAPTTIRPTTIGVLRRDRRPQFPGHHGRRALPRPAGRPGAPRPAARHAGRQTPAGPHLHLRRPPEPQNPNYRMVLVFDAANDLTAARGSAPARSATSRRWPSRPFNVFAVYCRNDLALSFTTAWTNASGPDDPRVQALFAQLFLVLFDDSPRRRFLYRPFFGW